MFAALLEIKDTFDSINESYMTLGFLWASPNLHWRSTSNMEHGSCHEEVSGGYYLIAIDYYSKLRIVIFCNIKRRKKRKRKKNPDHLTAF